MSRFGIALILTVLEMAPFVSVHAYLGPDVDCIASSTRDSGKPKSRIRIISLEGDMLSHREAVRILRDIEENLVELRPPAELHLDLIHELSGLQAEATFDFFVIASPAFVRPGAAAILIHEYGHLLFRWNLGFRSRPWRDFIDKIGRAAKAYEARLKPINDELSRVAETRARVDERLSASDLDPKQRSALEAKKKEVAAAMARVIDRYRAAIRTVPELNPQFIQTPPGDDLSAPYEEAFSDLLAVVAQNDPLAVAKALPADKVSGRDFTVRVAPEGWTDSDPHHALDPVRSFLWRDYFSKVTDRVERQKLLEKVYAVFADDLLEKAASEILRTETVSQFNRRLIQRLTRDL